MKIRTREQFTDTLDQEYNWRVLELENLNHLIAGASGTPKNGLLRAGIPILYAHWEGFIKVSTSYLVDYINSQKFNYIQLSNRMLTLSIRSKLNKLLENGFDFSQDEVCELLRSDLNERAYIDKLLSCFSAESNLSSTVFEKVANAIGLNTSRYQVDYPIINSTLLENRNKIAHGEKLFIDEKDFDLLRQRVLALLKTYKDDLQNYVTQQHHLDPKVAKPHIQHT